MRSVRILPAILILLLTLSTGVDAQTPPPNDPASQVLEFADPSALAVTIERSKDSANLDVTIRNLTDTELVVKFCFLEDSPSASCENSSSSISLIDSEGTIAASSVQTFRLSVPQINDEKDVSGFLLASVDGQVVDIRPMAIKHGTISIPAWLILTASLLLAGIFTVFRENTLDSPRKEPVVDNPSFKGWATAITIVTGIGAPILKEFLDGKSSLLPNREFTVLGISFALMIFVAPLIYGLKTKPVEGNVLVVDNPGGPTETGTWPTFWVSITLSVWAFAGTSLTVAIYLFNAWDIDALSLMNSVILILGCVAMLLVLTLHSWWQIAHLSKADKPSDAQVALHGVSNIANPEVRRRFSGL